MFPPDMVFKDFESKIWLKSYRAFAHFNFLLDLLVSKNIDLVNDLRVGKTMRKNHVKVISWCRAIVKRQANSLLKSNDDNKIWPHVANRYENIAQCIESRHKKNT